MANAKLVVDLMMFSLMFVTVIIIASGPHANPMYYASTFMMAMGVSWFREPLYEVIWRYNGD